MSAAIRLQLPDSTLAEARQPLKADIARRPIVDRKPERVLRGQGRIKVIGLLPTRAVAVPVRPLIRRRVGDVVEIDKASTKVALIGAAHPHPDVESA